MELRNIFLDLATLNEPVTDKDKVGELLSRLPESFGFISLTADATSVNHDSLCTSLKSKMERGKGQSQPLTSKFIAFSFNKLAIEPIQENKKIPMHTLLKLWKGRAQNVNAERSSESKLSKKTL